MQPQLNGSNRLSQRRVTADRGEVLGEDDDVIAKLRPVVRIGIDKTVVDGEAAEASATKLAKLVGIDAKAYAKKVAGAGDDAFVEAITFRATDESRPTNAEVFAIKGALPIQGEAMLAPTRDFARPIFSASWAMPPRRSSTTPTVRWWPGTRSGCPGCRSGTTPRSAVRPGCRCGCCP